MRFKRLSILVVAWIGAGCAGAASRGGASTVGGEPAGAGGQETGGSGAASGGGGVPGTGGGGTSSETRDSGSGTTPDADKPSTADAATATAPDASSGAGGETDGGPALVDSNTPMSVDGAPPPSYEGEIPIFYGPEVGPIVQMNCPGDPTAGFTEYRDSFHVERPYNVPINTRFSIVGGIYNFWVFPPDFPHDPMAGGRNPRTEATYGGTRDKATIPGGTSVVAGIGSFSTGKRMYSADMLIESNAVGSAIMQIHATANGGPVGLRIMSDSNMVNNGSLTVVNGSSVPGGLIGKWFNFKVSLDTTNVQVQIFINNCLKSTYDGSGARGNGRYYFKNGVYFCKTSQNGCFSHYKNVHLYEK
jgi:hypothetical protein